MTYSGQGHTSSKTMWIYLFKKEIMHGKATAKVFIGQHSGKCKCRKGRYMESVNDRSFTLKPYTLHNGCPHIQWRAPFVPFLKAKSVLSSFPLVMTGMYVSCVIQKHLEQTMERRKRRIYCTLYSSHIMFEYILLRLPRKNFAFSMFSIIFVPTIRQCPGSVAGVCNGCERKVRAAKGILLPKIEAIGDSRCRQKKITAVPPGW